MRINMTGKNYTKAGTIRAEISSAKLAYIVGENNLKKGRYENMKILSVEKREEILFIGLIEGKEYKGLINPSVLGGIDAYTEEAIKIETTTTFFELNGEKYYTIVGTDKSGKIVYTEIQENK